MTDTDALRTAFLEGMSLSAATVCIVTTDGPAGRHGVTVSATTSISADGEAPTVLACVNASSATAPAILENGVFAINVLRDTQNDISDVFARRKPAPGDDKFNAARHGVLVTGAPVLLDALVRFDCRLISGQKLGTHHLFIGAVEAVETAEEGKPLLYGMRQYLRADRH